jgi:Domain of unknown function (DUF4440)
MNKLFILLLLTSFQIVAQVEKSSELYKTLKKQDSLLFNVGFNNCNMSQFENILDTNFESFSAQKGIIHSKSEFIQAIKNGLCKSLVFKKRELVNNSFELFPLEENGILYGAIQSGIHNFYSIENGIKKEVTSSAKFTHIWLIKNDIWKLTKVLSYDQKDF